MAFCSKCGTAISEGSAFCSVCGSPASLAGAQIPPPPPPLPSQQVGPASAGISSNVVAALSYFFITGIIFLLMDQFKGDRFVRFHSFQSIAYGIVVTIFSIVWSNVVFVTIGSLWTLISLVSTLIHLAIFAYWLFLMYKAYNNETYKIPVLGDWAEKQAAK